MVNNDMIETEELNEKTNRVEKPKDAATVIKQYEDIIRTKKKNIISIAYHQGKVFKGFKDKENFIRLVNKFKIYKSTIICKIYIFNLIDKYLKMMKSICKENLNDFEQLKVVCLRKLF